MTTTITTIKKYIIKKQNCQKYLNNRPIYYEIITILKIAKKKKI